MVPTIYVDVRCLQDPKYRVRGIGQHVAALLRARKQSAFANWRAVGLSDPQSPKLTVEDSLLLDEVNFSLNPCCNGAPAVFIDGTPMTHDTRFSLRLLGEPAFFKAAVVYDFIPLEWPGYLPTTSLRIDYVAKLARLRKFDLFLPISRYTALRLSELLGISDNRIQVTGASVRRSLYQYRDSFDGASSAYHGKNPYFVIVVAGDARKNPEVAVEAVRRLNILYSRRIALKVVGHYEKHYKNWLLQLAGHPEGAGFLELCSDLSDEELVAVYAGATATIAPSHIEGFSLPIVEASLCGSPAIASTCAAHLELIDQPEALFPSTDAAALAEKLEALLNYPPLRDSLLSSQAHLSEKFHEDAVGRRFWSAIELAVNPPHDIAATVRPKKPRLAFLSPYPPDQSGVARYTAMTMQSAHKLFDSDLYSDAPRPLALAGPFRDCGGVSLAPIINGEYNGVISVLGNSHFHTRIFEVFEEYGGPCILHDARLIQIYIERLGSERFLKFAARFLGRLISMEEVHAWLHERNPASLLLEPIIERASPLMVHTVTQQAEIKRRYGANAEVITSCPTVFFDNEELTSSAKQAVREQYGIPADTFLVSSFGVLGPEKGMDTLIVGIELLRSWNIPAELYFVGKAAIYKNEIDRLAATYGISEYVHSDNHFVSDQTYRDFLIGSDAAVQLRTYSFGQLSAALTDCISAGIACVANADLAKSCDAPGYVSIVPDQFSPLQVAEQLALIWETKTECGSRREARAAYLETHNFDYYGKRLVEILGLV